MMKVAFIGLGVMGYPMAGHLANAGLDVCVYNRTREKAQNWLDQFTGSSADTPATAAMDAELVFTCVGNDEDLREVVIGTNGIIHSICPDSILVDHTTASAQIAQEIGSILQAKGAGFLDAPVSGGQQGAENGLLTIMCGGEQTCFDRVQPVMNHYARQTSLMGAWGAGQLTKMVNQICIAGLIQSLAEGVQFAQKSGLDVEQVFDVIGKGAAQSWQMDNRHKTMNQDQYDHGFAVDWMRKDLNICLQEARKNGAHLPVAALVDQFYSEVQKMGGGRWDTSSLLKRLVSS
ncbi:NAD(P)-dependent oxidoreductase [Ketobacter sp.]|uniref:NAD(P)-dependent oxidoreductase n=1 Tax=Ketobacter sp. TaxID=2083498 RepID=UPI000F20EBB1|nr:NAD(P)-dependent oxidoreductase [Ketobacter sp.]RLT97955.1 MAG: NAD(P)-dependent oxidoreductase [Ketobacter sp.]